MPLQFRPRSAPDAPAYSPERDVAYVGPAMLQAAARLMDHESWSTEFAGCLSQAGVTESQFLEVVMAVGAATKTFMLTNTIKHPMKALDSAGFFKLPLLANRLYFSAFGEMMYVCMLQGLRQTSRLNQDSVMQPEIASYLDWVEAYLKHRGFALTPELDTDGQSIHDLQMTVAHQRAMIDLLQSQIDPVPANAQSTEEGPSDTAVEEIETKTEDGRVSL